MGSYSIMRSQYATAEGQQLKKAAERFSLSWKWCFEFLSRRNMSSIRANRSWLWEEPFQSETPRGHSRIAHVTVCNITTPTQQAHKRWKDGSCSTAVLSFLRILRHRKVTGGHSLGNSKNGANVSKDRRQECHDPLSVMSLRFMKGNRQWRFVASLL